VAMFVPIVLLFLIASFGVGFMLNMITKRMPWTSTAVAAALALYFVIAMEETTNKVLLALPVLAGGLIASLTIRKLQRSGFKMFG